MVLTPGARDVLEGSCHLAGRSGKVGYLSVEAELGRRDGQERQSGRVDRAEDVMDHLNDHEQPASPPKFLVDLSRLGPIRQLKN